jgi:hypothetical protein
MYAHKVDMRRHRAGSPGATAEQRWPRHRRLVFLAGAAMLSWVLPLLAVYVFVAR